MRATHVLPTSDSQRSLPDEPPPAPRIRRSRGKHLLSRAPIAICAAVLFALCTSYIMLLHSGSVRIQQSDFLVYYSASHLVLGGHGNAIYTFPVLKAVEASLLPSLLLVRSEAVFLYPPFVALILTPLAALGYSVAYLLWFFLNCVLLAGVFVGLRRYLHLGRSGSVLLVVAGTSFFPVFATLAQGQVSVVLLAVLTASFLALRADRDGWGGALLALALLKPPYVIPFLLLLVMQGRWRGVAGFCAVAAALAVLPVAVLGASINGDYVHVLREASGWHTATGGFSARANQNLAGFFQLLFGIRLATVLQGAGSIAALTTVAVISRRCRAIDLPFAGATVTALLVNPHVLIHDLSLLLIPAAIAIHTTRNRDPALRMLLVGGYCVALVGIPLSKLIPIQLPVLAMVAVLLWTLRASARPAAAALTDIDDDQTVAPGSALVVRPAVSQ